MGRLDDKVAIITGGGTGIGWAIAEALAAEGAKLVIACRRREVGEKAVGELSGRGAEALFVQTDISVPDEGRALVRQTLAHFDGLDILVNNAGISTDFVPFLELSEKQFDLVVGTNLRGTFFLSQAAAREMAGGARLLRGSGQSGPVCRNTDGAHRQSRGGGRCSGLPRLSRVELPDGHHDLHRRRTDDLLRRANR